MGCKNNCKKLSEKFANNKICCTFALGLVREFISNDHNLLVISFSVINYVVSMRCPHVSGDSSFCFMWIRTKNAIHRHGTSMY